MKTLITIAAASLALAAGAAMAANEAAHQEHGHGAPGTGAAVVQADGAAMTEGEVRKIDKDNKKITLKHGEIKNLGMPAMTMVFRVTDPALLDAVQAGAKVRFRAEQDGSGYMVTAIEPLK
jgi:Cu/Ag efflux protein CusF